MFPPVINVSQWLPNKLYRSSHSPQVFHKNGVLKNFAKLIGKHIQWSPSFNKVADTGILLLEAYNFIKMSHQHRYFPANFGIYSGAVFLSKVIASVFIHLFEKFYQVSPLSFLLKFVSLIIFTLFAFIVDFKQVLA